MKEHFKSLLLSTFLTAVLCIPFKSGLAIGAETPGPDPDVPIDGGLSILIAAGVGYGVKKLRDERKKKSIKL